MIPFYRVEQASSWGGILYIQRPSSGENIRVYDEHFILVLCFSGNFCTDLDSRLGKVFVVFL